MSEPAIAALFVDPRGVYMNDPRFDPWPEARDARTYAGNLPVIAHPPCNLWVNMAASNWKRYGRTLPAWYLGGTDGGCFASALASVRRCGGVLEHPASSHAWAAHGLPRPDFRGGWLATECGGFVCHVEQGKYGHKARKSTWLYVHGVPLRELPELKWGRGASYAAWVTWCHDRRNPGRKHERLTKREASATPPEFLTVLVYLATVARP